MRPLVLTLQAFGPFVDQQTVDFRDLDSGLFLISGPTGAGKTSIFDALSFALFGQASGSWRKQRNLRSHQADPQLDTFVRLEFTQQGKTYCIERIPAYDRPKKIGSGMTKQQAEQVLKLPNGRILTKQEEIDQEIQNILGIGVDQFRQVSMLAQGEFSNFLKAGSSERSDILRRIFQTDQLQLFQTRLRDLVGKAKQDLQEARTKARFALESLDLVSPDLLESWQDLRKQGPDQPLDLAIPLALLAQEAERDREMAVEVAAQKKVLEDQQAKLSLELAKAKESLELAQRWATLQHDLALAEQAAPGLAQKNQRLTRDLDLLAKVTARRTDYDQAKGRRDDLLEAQKHLQETYTKVLEPRKAKLARQLSAFQQEAEARQDQAQKAQLLQASLGQYEKLAAEQAAVKAIQKELNLQKKCYWEVQAQAEKSAAAWAAWQAQEAQRLSDLAHQARLLAASLKEGEPCPVCGSIHHPQPASGEYGEGEILVRKEGEIPGRQELARQAQEDGQALQTAQRTLDRLQEKLDLVTANVQAWSKDLPYPSLAEAQKALEAWAQNQRAWQEYQKQLEAEKAQVEDQDQAYKAQADSLAGQLAEAQSQWQKQEDQLLSLLQGFGLENLEAYEALGLEEGKLQAQASQVKADQDRLQALRMEAQAFQKNWQPPETLPDLNQVQAAREAVSSQLEDIQNAQAQRRSREAQNQRLKLQLEALQEDIDQLELDFRNLLELYQVATGQLKGGLNRDFETFVQGYYFQWILEAANLRLSTMTGQRYRLVHSSAPADRRRTTGLEMEVWDSYTGQSRELSTLSGGESFQAAMALALGLSDVARASQGGLALETLFIDEGFGSLDRETLHQAVNTLLDLSSGSYLCGLISHVEELKEMIPQRLEVRKTEQGSHIDKHFAR